MEIKWFGQSCFQITVKDAVLVFDPYSEEIGLKLPSLKADIVLVSHQHRDHNNTAAVSGTVSGRPKVFSEPGEYETAGVYIEGVASFHDAAQGQERGANTIFVADCDGVRVCHLGDLGHELSSEQLEAIGEADLLMIPVGGIYTIDAQKAIAVINQIEPKIIIPMHYKIPGLNIDLADLTEFVQQADISDIEEKDSLNVTKADLPKEEREFVILKPQNK